MTFMMKMKNLKSTPPVGGGSDTIMKRRPRTRRKRRRESTALWNKSSQPAATMTITTLCLMSVYLSSFTRLLIISPSSITITADAYVLYPKQHEKSSSFHQTHDTLAFSRTRQNCWFSPCRSSSSSSVSSSRWQYQQRKLQTSSSSLLVLWMGKGDGKKKRKKKSDNCGAINGSGGNGAPSSSSSSSAGGGGSSSSSSTTASSSSSSPLRVTTNSLVPVRRQLLYAKLNKEFFKQASAGFRQQHKKLDRTKYRRTWDDEEIELKAEERKRKGQDPDWDVILSRSSVAPLVIVDGYNIIYQWKRLKKHMLKGDLQQARQLLVDDLENLRVIKGWRIEVVFDGGRRSTIGPLGHGPASVLVSNNLNGAPTTTLGQLTRGDQQSKASVSKHGVRVVYSGVGMEADTYIESRCMQAKNVTNGALTGSFIVATDDAMIRLAGQSAGALCMSADRFVNELKAVKQTVSYRVEAAVAKVNGHSIRPEKLRGTAIAMGRFGRGSVLIEDRRNRTTVKQRKEQEQLRLQAHAVTIDKDSIVDFSQMPTNQTKPYYGQ